MQIGRGLRKLAGPVLTGIGTVTGQPWLVAAGLGASAYSQSKDNSREQKNAETFLSQQRAEATAAKSIAEHNAAQQKRILSASLARSARGSSSNGAFAQRGEATTPGLTPNLG